MGDDVQGQRQAILTAVERFGELALEPGDFLPGETPIPVSGKVLRPDDLVALVDASLDGWLTGGRFTAAFERALSRRVGTRHAVFVNSGSSANLLALTALTSPQLGKRRLVPGDEVLTVAVGFPTTVNPIVQNRLRPVLVDVELGTYDVNPELLAGAIGPRTKAIMLAHTLGNPFDVDAVRALCDEHGLWLVEDSCDALGSTYRGRATGSFGDTATASFYPAHHITTGEGGAVFVRSPRLKKIIESFRDWGRDCYCATGCDNTCQKRFSWQLGDLPEGYDHKYIYSHVGYNLKATDMQAALGLSQLQRLDEFGRLRREAFSHLRGALEGVPGLVLPHATHGSDPSWFGFPITLDPSHPVDREALLRWLDARRIGTRLMFAGNIVRQPAYRDVDFRIASTLEVADIVMRRTFWVGTWPGLSPAMLDYVATSIAEFMASVRP